MGKFYQCIQSYGPSFMTKFCSALYLENLLRNIFAKLNLRGGVSCMPAGLLFCNFNLVIFRGGFDNESKWTVGTLCAQLLLQFYSDSLETLQMS